MIRWRNRQHVGSVILFHTPDLQKNIRKICGLRGKEKGQTLISEDLSSVAPVSVELLNLWNDFRKVVRFIDENPWVKPLLARIQSDKNRGGK